MKVEIITLAGKPGSGKTTTANRAAELLGYERYSAGSFIRTIATRRGMTIEEASVAAMDDHSIDQEMDRLVEEIGRTKTHMVIDGRLAFHFIPNSFKVYLELDLAIAAERIFKEDNVSRIARGELAATKEEMYESIAHRYESEQKRYYDLYKIDPHNTTHFDLVVDTTHDSADRVAERIVQAYNVWLQAK